MVGTVITRPVRRFLPISLRWRHTLTRVPKGHCRFYEKQWTHKKLRFRNGTNLSNTSSSKCFWDHSYTVWSCIKFSLQVWRIWDFRQEAPVTQFSRFPQFCPCVDLANNTLMHFRCNLSTWSLPSFLKYLSSSTVSKGWPCVTIADTCITSIEGATPLPSPK